MTKITNFAHLEIHRLYIKLDVDMDLHSSVLELEVVFFRSRSDVAIEPTSKGLNCMIMIGGKLSFAIAMSELVIFVEIFCNIPCFSVL